MALTTAQQQGIIKTVVAMYNASVGVTYMNMLAGYGSNVSALYNDLANSSSFQGLSFSFSNASTNNQFSTAFVNQLIGTSGQYVTAANHTAAIAYVEGLLNGGSTRGSAMMTTVDLLSSVATSDTNWGAAKSLLDNRVTVATDYTVTQSGNATSVTTLQGTISTVTNLASSVTAAIATNLGASGQTFTLTTGVDTVTGGAGNDTINGGTSASWSSFDKIDGGAGTDTMTVLVTDTATPGSISLTNVENLTINTTGAGYTIDSTGYTGLTSLTLQDSTAGAISVTGSTTTAATIAGTGISNVAVIGTGGALSVTTGAGTVDIGQTSIVNALTSATVVGGTTVKISDNKTTTKADGTTLTTVSLKGNTGAATLDTDGLTTLTLTNIVKDAADVTINADAGTRALTVNVSGIDDDAAGSILVTDATATSLAINATSTSKDLKFTAGAAKAVTVAASAALTIDDLVAGAATTVGISGAGKTTITADTLATTAVITSTSTGGVTLTQALTANQQYVGSASSGVDTIGVATGFTKAITTGAGNDAVTYGGPAGTGGSIDAGDGTDSIVMTAAQAVTATGSTTFAGTVSNFETLKLSAATGAAAAINMANADGMNTLDILGATVGALTVTNAAANFTLTQRALTSFASSIALASDTGTSDNVNLVYTAADGFTSTAAFTIANVETLTITTTDADTTAQTAVIVTPITAAAAATVTLAGNMGVSLIGGMTQTTLTSLDASGLTASGAFGGLTWTSGALAAAATVKGSAAGTNTIDFTAATKAVTYTGGSGNDAITANVTGAAATIDLGNGTNSVAAGTATKALTVTGGTGVDTITTGSGADIINGGAGADVINSGTGLDQITGGAGNDNFTINANANGNIFATILDATAGDILTFTDTGTETFATAKLSLGGTAVFQDYLNLAAAGAGNVNAALSWFQFGGNTYVVEDLSAGASFVNGTDLVVALTGLIDLSTATGAGTNALTIV